MLLFYFLSFAFTLFLLSIPRSFKKVPIGTVIDPTDESLETKKKKKPAVRVGWWESLKMSALMIFSPQIPNYEITDRKTREWGRPVWMVPLPKSALALVTDLTIAKQIMSSTAWARRFADDYYLFKCTWGKPYGLLFGGGEYWAKARAISLRLLHQLKFFNVERLEELIAVETSSILEELEGKVAEDVKAGGPGEATICPYHMFQVNAVNLVAQVCWSEKFTQDSWFIQVLGGAANDMNRSFNAAFGILELFPWLSMFPSLSYYGDYKKANDICVGYFMDIIKERRRTGTYKTEPIDFTDYFMQEIDKQENPAVINDENYCVIMRDMTWAGADTTSSTMEHGILQMALRPEIQTKVQEEIDQVIGSSRAPTYADRSKMTYTQAVLLEILRYATPTPATARSPGADMELCGETIPKGSLVGVNLYTIHRSYSVWEDPFEFRPERFLGPAGQIVNAEKIMPFGFGKRMCIGESVARIFLFLTFVTLLQRYTITLSKKHPPPSLKNLRGISRSPAPYHVTFTPRC